MNKDLAGPLEERLHDYEEHLDDNSLPFNPTFFQSRAVSELLNQAEPNRKHLAWSTSAGKTTVPVETTRRMLERDPDAKTLVLAPKQALQENWNERVLHENYNAAFDVHDTVSSPHVRQDASLLAVNYSKLNTSLKPDVVTYAKDADIVVADEAHRFKNKDTDANGHVTRIIEKHHRANPDGLYIGLSATPIPKDPADIGPMLYALDPERFKHYKNHEFNINKDWASVQEMIASRRIDHIPREVVAEATKDQAEPLPDWDVNPPQSVDMRSPLEEAYLECYTTEPDDKNPGLDKIRQLDYVSIVNLIDSDEFIEDLATSPGTDLIFSPYLNVSDDVKQIIEQHYEQQGMTSPLRDEEETRSIFKSIERRVKEYNPRMNVEKIYGAMDTEERLAVQRDLENGSVDLFMGTTQCVGEGFSLKTGGNNARIIPLLPPFSPGKKDQMIGRAVRRGQRGTVVYQPFVSESEHVRAEAREHVKSKAEEMGKVVNPRIQFDLLPRMRHNINTDREELITAIIEGTGGVFTEQRNLDDIVKTFVGERQVVIGDTGDDDNWGEGIIDDSTKHIGRSYDDGLGQQGEGNNLAEDYLVEDILERPPGQHNLYVASQVQAAKDGDEPWQICDLGSSASAVYSQANMVVQSLHGDEHPDQVTNVDGKQTYLESAETFIKSGRWLTSLGELSFTEYSDEDVDHARRDLKQSLDDLTERLSYEQGDFTEPGFSPGERYDAVVTSKSLHYNDQKGRRDIEHGIVNVNQMLRDGGRYFITLIDAENRYKRDRQNISGIETLVDMYGFNIQESETVRPNGENPTHYIHAVKDEPVNAVRDDDPDITVYDPSMYGKVLTGKARERRLYETDNGQEVSVDA